MYYFKNSLIAFAGFLAIIGGNTIVTSRIGHSQAASIPHRHVKVSNLTSEPVSIPGDTTFAALSQQPKTASSPGASSGTEDELVRLSQLWMDAAMAHDMKTLEELVADDFMGFFPVRGDVGKRAEWMANVRDPNRFQPIAWKYSNIQVRHHGENLAVVSSLASWKGTFNGQLHNDTGGLVDVWEKRKGKWQVVTRYIVPWKQLKTVIDAEPK